MKDFRFIFLRLSLYLILGILTAFYIPASTEIILITGIVLFILFILFFIRAYRIMFPDSFFGIFSFLLIIYLGFFTAYFSIPENQNDHYINQKIVPTENTLLVAKISEELKPTAYNTRYILETEKLIAGNEALEIQGKILLNLKTDSSRTNVQRPGMRLLILWRPENISDPLNPYQFSYKDYMSQLKIEKQINADFSSVIVIDQQDNLRSWAWSLRERIISDLKKQQFGTDEIAVFQTLILGQRREISNQLYADYAAAGAIHILAISGLHIGILLFILNLLLKTLERMKNGKIIKTVALIGLLWSFAILTGLSPSVVRAVTMFSFIAVGLQMKRKTSTLNSLFLSLFVLLLINPYFIFQVGFQLSYLAVFSIITFQPFIYKLFAPKNKLIDYFWKLSSVSIAAQIGVIPLCLFYFHQFPGLFLLTNLVILPFLGLILAIGVLIILLSSFNLISNILVDLFDFILQVMNSFVQWIGSIETLVFSNIPFSLFQTLSLYLIILGCLLLMKKLNFSRICLLLVSILLFQGSTIYFSRNIPNSEAIVFHKTGESIIAMKSKRTLKIYSETSSENSFLKDYSRERKIENFSKHKSQNIIDFSDKMILFIDTTKNYNLNNFQPEIIILSNSPKINLERILDDLSPKQIVVDGSNYYSLVDRWKETAYNKKIPFHYTREKGAYIINSYEED